MWGRILGTNAREIGLLILACCLLPSRQFSVVCSCNLGESATSFWFTLLGGRMAISLYQHCYNNLQVYFLSGIFSRGQGFWTFPLLTFGPDNLYSRGGPPCVLLPRPWPLRTRCSSAASCHDNQTRLQTLPNVSREAKLSLPVKNYWTDFLSVTLLF